MRESTGRALRIAELKNIIEVVGKAGEFAIENKLLAELSLKWSVSIRKVKEYLNLLIDTEQAIRTDKGISTVAVVEAQKILDVNSVKEKSKSEALS